MHGLEKMEKKKKNLLISHTLLEHSKLLDFIPTEMCF